MRNYKQFTLLLESKKRDQKIEKQKKKIHKFLTYEPIIDFVFDTVVDEDSTKGLQYVVWFADKIKKYFIKRLKERRISEPANIEEFLSGKKTNDNFLKSVVDDEWNNGEHYRFINTIIDWLKSPIRSEEVNLKDFDTLEKAFEESEKWHDNLKATGTITNEEGTVLLSFDDGYYWIDLETNSSDEEANAMGHCGTTSYGDTLYSLRINQSPHVTAAVSDETVYQMKGRNNKRPVEKYHKYIMELLRYPNVSDNVRIVNEFPKITNFSTEEYLAEEDFHVNDLSGEQIKILISKNKELINNEGLGVKYKLYKEKLISKEELIKNYIDLMIVDGDIIFTVEDWSSFESIFAENNSYRKNWQYEVLTWQYDIYYDDLKFDYTYSYDKITKRGFEELWNHCTHEGYDIYYDEDGKQHSFMMSIGNTDVSPDGDDLWIKTPIGGVIPLKGLLSSDFTDVNTKNGKTEFYSWEFDELKKIMDNAYTRAIEIADQNEAFEYVTNKITDKIGDVNLDYSKYTGLHFKFNFDWVIKIENEGSKNNDSILEIINSIDSDMYSDSSLKIECDPPYYGWNGTIDKETMTDELINKLTE